MNREMASVYSSFSYFSLTTNLKYTVYKYRTLYVKWYLVRIRIAYSSLTTNLNTRKDAAHSYLYTACTWL